jgi:hypothetical protein
MVASCTGLEIMAIEASTATSSNPFTLRGILEVLNLPCVALTDASFTYGKEYCLQPFIALWSTYDANNGVMTSDELANTCRPCLALFIAEYSKYALPESVQTFAFIDLLCTYDTGRWCWVEYAALGAMPDNNATVQIAKAIRTCETRCLAKILVKIVASSQIFNTSEADVINARRYYAALNGLCAINANGDYCAVTAHQFDGLTDRATAHGCHVGTSPSCSNSSCSAYGTQFLASQGCCYTTLSNTM